VTMIPGDPSTPLFDHHNPLLTAGLPASITTGLVPSPDGQFGVATIRTPDATLSVTFANKAGIDEWIRLLTQLRDSLSTSGLIVATPNTRREGSARSR
jgi:hypothetical protein